MKRLIIVIFSLFTLSVFGQDIKSEFDGHQWDAPYFLPIPKDWNVERFLIPVSFAPQIKYIGIEDIRFSPGWSKVESDDYWSYAFLWYLDGKIKINAKIIGHNLKAYYTGLIGINGQILPEEQQIPTITKFKEIQTAQGDLKTYLGTIQTIDYMQNKPLILNCKVHWKSCSEENRTLIFFELSPKPLSHKIWSGLDQLWIDFNCKKD